MKTLFATLVTLATASFSNGAVVIYSFTGLIGAGAINENDILGEPGDAVSGSFSFDPLAVGGGTAADRTLNFMIGSRNINISSTLNFVRTENNVSVSGLGIVDRFRYGFDPNKPTTFLDPLYLSQIDVEFIDTSASIYDGSQTLDVHLNLTDYDVVRFFIRGSDLATRTVDFQARGTITSVSVPEMSTGMLLLGMPIVIFRRNRKSEQAAS
jgi:hypothetical protein